MFTLSAPYPKCETTTLLPNPQFGGAESVVSTVTTRRSVTGVLSTYVKKKGRRQLQWPFLLERQKMLELEAFIKAYFASQIKVIDHNGIAWVGYFVDNPFEYSTQFFGEMGTIQLTFEGTMQ